MSVEHAAAQPGPVGSGASAGPAQRSAGQPRLETVGWRPRWAWVRPLFCPAHSPALDRVHLPESKLLGPHVTQSSTTQFTAQLGLPQLWGLTCSRDTPSLQPQEVTATQSTWPPASVHAGPSARDALLLAPLLVTSPWAFHYGDTPASVSHSVLALSYHLDPPMGVIFFPLHLNDEKPAQGPTPLPAPLGPRQTGTNTGMWPHPHQPPWGRESSPSPRGAPLCPQPVPSPPQSWTLHIDGKLG